MALSDVIRKVVRSDLRSRLNKFSTEDFSDAELNQWLNLGQFETFVRLSSISDVWYGSTQTMTLGTAAAGTVSAHALAGSYGADKIAKIQRLITSTSILVPFASFNDLYSLLQNSNYDGSYGVSWYGEKLYVFVGASASALTSNACTLFFIRKPDEMLGDGSTFSIVSGAVLTGNGKMFNIWIGNQSVKVTARTTLGTTSEGIAYQDSATASVKATNIYNALLASFPVGSGITLDNSTPGTVLISGGGITDVQNVDGANLTFTTTVNACVDVPTEFVDLVIMSALSKALLKLNMMGEKSQVEADIASKFNDIRSLYANEMQLMQIEKTPGLQSPRNR